MVFDIINNSWRRIYTTCI